MKKDMIKSIISLAVIIVLAVLIVNMNKFISPNVPNAAEVGDSPLTDGSQVDYGECFSEDLSTVLFVYSNTCPYCNQMKPIVKELEDEGYGFYWAEGSDSSAMGVISTCFSDLIGGYVPQFICPSNGQEQTGAMDKADLKKFADDCA